jgi:hypothetical protein
MMATKVFANPANGTRPPSNHNQGATMNTTTKLVGAPIAVDYLPTKGKHSNQHLPNPSHL